MVTMLSSFWINYYFKLLRIPLDMFWCKKLIVWTFVSQLMHSLDTAARVPDTKSCCHCQFSEGSLFCWCWYVSLRKIRWGQCCGLEGKLLSVVPLVPILATPSLILLPACGLGRAADVPSSWVPGRDSLFLALDWPTCSHCVLLGEWTSKWKL